MGVSIAIFNQISKITIIPLVSVTTSLVAEEDAAEQSHQSEKEILLEESNVNVKVDIEDKTGIYIFQGQTTIQIYEFVFYGSFN